MKTLIAALMVVGLSLGFAACKSIDNVGACKDMVKVFTDCNADMATSFPDTYCDAYDAYDCDLVDYFDCVSAAMGACTDGTFPDMDTTELSNCTSLAVCT